MISRIWHGCTTFENADTYERLLKEEIYTGIKDRNIKGLKGFHMLRRDTEHETEYVTIMWFDSLDAVKEFAGPEYENAVVPEEAQKVLSRFDNKSQHYEVKIEDFQSVS
jgi:heme-degrading monooxygenase HmoA